MDQIMSRLQAQGGTSRSIHVEQKRAGRKDKAQKHRLPNAHVLPVPGWLEKQRTDRRSDTTATLNDALSRSSVAGAFGLLQDHQEQTPLHESLDRSSVAGIYGFAEPPPLQSSLSRASVADAYGVSDFADHPKHTVWRDVDESRRAVQDVPKEPVPCTTDAAQEQPLFLALDDPEVVAHYSAAAPEYSETAPACVVPAARDEKVRDKFAKHVSAALQHAYMDELGTFLEERDNDDAISSFAPEPARPGPSNASRSTVRHTESRLSSFAATRPSMLDSSARRSKFSTRPIAMPRASAQAPHSSMQDSPARQTSVWPKGQRQSARAPPISSTLEILNERQTTASRVRI